MNATAKNFIPERYLLKGAPAKRWPLAFLMVGLVFYGLAFVVPSPEPHNEASHSAQQQKHSTEATQKPANHDAQQKHHSSYKRKKFFHAYLSAYAFFTSLLLGGMFFVLTQHLTKAGWSVTLRRLAEQLIRTSWLLPILFVPLLFGTYELYHWSHQDALETDHLLKHKEPYLNLPFFYLRMALYFAAWVAMSFLYSRASVRQDKTKDPNITKKLQKLSPVWVFVYAFTLTFFSMDVFMSLSPHWYSTMFGVYYFAGGVVGFMAFLSFVALSLRRMGYLRGEITVSHYHDAGKLLFGFVCFWGYIAFSQYFLIWYASIPEETLYYLNRLNHNWKFVSYALAVGHFALPFVFFLSRNLKRNLATHAFMAVWLLVFHYVDMYWLVSPNVDPYNPNPNLVDVFCLLGMGGIFLGVYLFYLRKNSLVALQDPRVHEALGVEDH